jgi:hypothetical protein
MEKNFIRTTHQQPKLTNFNLKNKVQVEGVVPVPKTVKKWNLNKILFISFVLFTIFFLYNCRYGIFKSTETHNVYPFSVVS